MYTKVCQNARKKSFNDFLGDLNRLLPVFLYIKRIFFSVSPTDPHTILDLFLFKMVMNNEKYCSGHRNIASIYDIGTLQRQTGFPFLFENARTRNSCDAFFFLVRKGCRDQLAIPQNEQIHRMNLSSTLQGRRHGECPPPLFLLNADFFVLYIVKLQSRECSAPSLSISWRSSCALNIVLK